MKPHRTSAATATGLALTLALTLGACGAQAEPGADGQSAAATDPTAHNEADTTFAQMMVVHHEGAIEMARLAAEQASTDEVRALGERIATAQGPEIDLMRSWLQAWAEPAPEDAAMGGMEHGGMDMEGLSQDEVMAELSGLDGVELDRRFLELMTDHHRGAIEMAGDQRADGENAEAVQLSGKIIDDQTAEITQMSRLLDELE